MSNLLQRLLLENAPGGSITSSTVTDWSSITFSGEKHQICLQFDTSDHASQFYTQVLNEKVDINLSTARKMCADVRVVETDPDLDIVTVEIVTLNE